MPESDAILEDDVVTPSLDGFTANEVFEPWNPQKDKTPTVPLVGILRMEFIL